MSNRKTKTQLWVEQQFSQERMIRWIDGVTPERKYGNHSFAQVSLWHWDYARNGRRTQTPIPNIWSVVNCTVGPFRARYYMKVWLSPLQGPDAGFKAEGWIYSYGISRWCPRRKLKFELEFTPKENAPKKLNRTIRQLRQQLFARPDNHEEWPDPPELKW